MFLFRAGEMQMPDLLTMPKRSESLEVFQKHVDGRLEIYPHTEGLEADFLAYSNDEGLLKNLPPNKMASEVLKQLGFDEMSVPFGNLLLMGADDRPLKREQQERVLTLCKKYRGKK